MAKKATGDGAAKSGAATGGVAKAKTGAKASGAKSGSNKSRGAKPSGGSRASGSKSEAFIKLLQSPLVAELVAIAATAAIAALSEHGFPGSRKGAGKAVKQAGKAAAAAVGRRLGTEIEEIRMAATGK